MTPSSAAPLTFLSERLLAALQAAGENGLDQEGRDALGIPQLDWRLNELRSHGIVVAEDRDVWLLVHGRVVSTGGSGASTVAAAAGDAAQTGPPVDLTPTLFEAASTEAPGVGAASAPPAGRGAAGASVDAAHRVLREAA